MTPQEFIVFRKQLGWSLATLSRHIGITASWLADYETGHTRDKNKKPVPIPPVVELACKWLEHEHRPLTRAERAARWRDFLASMPRVDHVIDDRREATYEPDRGLRARWSTRTYCCAGSNRRTTTI
jgi:transcriptional regulator with XRE-family HTH domain